MKNKGWWLALSLLALASCKTANLKLANIQTQKNISITSDLVEDVDAATLIEPYKQELAKKMSEKIVYTDVDLNKKGDNSNLGNLLSDYTYNVAKDWGKANGLPKIDAAVINIGGIRSTIGKGDILLKNIFEVMPFENELVIMKLKGSDIQGLFNYYLERQVNNPVSNIVIETENGKLNKALIDGKAVVNDQDYYIATSDYLSLGGDYMKFFTNGKAIATGIKLRDAYIEEFRKNKDIVAPSDVRLNFIGKSSK